VKKYEALEHFQQNIVNLKSKQKMQKVEEFFLENKDELVKDLVQSFSEICIKIKQMQSSNEKSKIGFITYSLLRTSMKEKRLTYLVEAFDNRWFFDRVECQTEYEANWLLKFLNELETELENERRQYFNMIVKADIEKIKLKEVGYYNQYLALLGRYAASEMLSLKEYGDIEKDEQLEVRVGEYLDISEIIFKEDFRVRDSKEVKAWLEEKSDRLYWSESLRNYDFSDGNFESKSFNYSDFSMSNISNCKMKSCMLIGTKFSRAIMKNTDLSCTYIYDADFSDCDLEGASFCKADGEKGKFYNTKFKRRSLWGVSFEGANLENADFENANLKGATFKDARLLNVNFKGAVLYDAVFSKSAIELLSLDDEQLKSIILL